MKKGICLRLVLFALACSFLVFSHLAAQSSTYPNGRELADSNGNVFYPNGSRARTSDGSVYYRNGFRAVSNGLIYYPNGFEAGRIGGSIYYPSGRLAYSSEGTVYYENGFIARSGRTTYYKNGFTSNAPITIKIPLGHDQGVIVLRCTNTSESFTLLLNLGYDRALIVVAIRAGLIFGFIHDLTRKSIHFNFSTTILNRI